MQYSTESTETSTFLDSRSDNFKLNWRGVRNRHKPNRQRNLLTKQDEEFKRYEDLRKSDISMYFSQINEICQLKASNPMLGQKMRCHIPKEYFEKRITCKTLDIDDEKRTSLDVHVPAKSEDFISRQAKYRRSLAFKKYLKNQEIENLLSIPLIEEDAADLADIIATATNKPSMPKKSTRNPSNDIEKLPYLMELDDKPKAGLLVSCYVKEHILKLPLLIPHALRIRELYTNCIIKDIQLNRLYNRRRDMLPKDLVDYIADFGASNENENSPKIIKDEIADRDQFFHTSINVYANDILREIEIDSLEFSVFIKPCYILHYSQVMPNYLLLDLNDPSKIQSVITDIINLLEVDIMNPVSLSRKQLMGSFMIGNTNQAVAQIFVDLLPNWFEALTKGLFSLHNPVREECCYCVGYLFTQTKLLYDLLNFHSSEFVYEMTNVIFRVIEHYPSSFELFYSLIGYIMDGCPLITILNCICDKGPMSKNFLMRKRWPKFIVFACKHWPSESFKGGQFTLKKIQDLLEKSFLQAITHKTSKMALAYIGRRFERRALTVTHWVLNRCGPPDET